MRRFLAISALVAVGATVVHAQNLSVIKERRVTMRDLAGASSPNFKMMKGDVSFDLTKVQANLKVMREQITKFKGQFPGDSKQGGDTSASPDVWTMRGEFDSVVDKWLIAIKAAEAKIKDEASFKAEYPAVAKGCGGCHREKEGFAPSLKEMFKKPKP